MVWVPRHNLGSVEQSETLEQATSPEVGFTQSYTEAPRPYAGLFPQFDFTIVAPV